MALISSFDLEARISMRQASSVPAPCHWQNKKTKNNWCENPPELSLVSRDKKNNHKTQKHWPAEADWLKDAAAGWDSHLDGVPQLVGVVHWRQHQQAQDYDAKVPTQLRGQVFSQVLWAKTAVSETRPRGLAVVPDVRIHLNCSTTRGGCFSQFGVERPHCTSMTACGRRHDSLFLPACKDSAYIHTHTQRWGLTSSAAHTTLSTPSCGTQLT